jgi:hypothetical protein
MAIDVRKKEAERVRRAAAVEKRKNFVEFDEAPSGVTDHAFEPRGAWYTQCRHCGLAMAAHRETTVNPRDHIGYVREDEDD